MFTRSDETFDVEGVPCAAWLYRPVEVERPPVVVMAHGFGAHRSFRLPCFAERFAAGGLAVLLFDHRGLGDSDGKPRGLVDPFRQLDDWRSAIAYVRRHPELDGDRIGLWGTSFSGGHVISLAAEDPGIAAIVAQVPFVDPISTARLIGAGAIARLLLAGCRDRIRSLFGCSLRIPVVGPPGTTACMTTPAALDGYRSIVGSEPWENSCPARSAFAFTRYRPMWRARDVRCPAFVALAEQDSLIAPRVVERAAGKMDAELLRLDCGHFDVYHDPIATELADRESAFLRRSLGVTAGVESWVTHAA